MFIDDSHGLHVGVANGRSDETEAALLKIFAHCIALPGRLGDAPQVERAAAQRAATREPPDVIVEGVLGGTNRKISLRIGDERLHFEAISDDPRILQQASALGGVVAGHFLGVEIVEGSRVVFALAQNGEPAQACLRAFETQHLEQLLVIVQRPPPFRIVIRNVQGIRRAPRAAQLAVGMPLRSQFSPVWMTRHGRISAVQTHGVAILVYQLDAVDAVRAARCAADFVHELEEHPGVEVRGKAQARLYPEVQHGKTLMGGTNENGHTQRPAEIRYREQGLHAGDVSHADMQSAVLLVDFRHSVGIYGLLDPDSDTMLIDVEEQQLFQRGALVYR
jgi:hypothetical protein